ncbi:SPOR domain-containing protein [Magnetofaba australis]|uniref:Putative sporulation domain-containing protein n=1 Tax=Magnetofaba australis IT-1 TaxID=1434232 RepID=A0A1Y2K3Y8_9PROT|nr:SPOR domain-containing protein [Magnetofaba australis]OSM02367.1 putative sporulation domain-containing protein [Magnetofaba australis IT-1]
MLLAWALTLLGLNAAHAAPTRKPAYITNAYFSSSLEKTSEGVRPGPVVSVLPANADGVAGYFIMDAVLVKPGSHVFEVEILDEKRLKVATMAYDPVEASGEDYIYTVVGSVAGAFPQGWLHFEVYDRVDGGAAIHVSSHAIMTRDQERLAPVEEPQTRQARAEEPVQEASPSEEEAQNDSTGLLDDDVERWLRAMEQGWTPLDEQEARLSAKSEQPAKRKPSPAAAAPRQLPEPPPAAESVREAAREPEQASKRDAARAAAAQARAEVAEQEQIAPQVTRLKDGLSYVSLGVFGRKENAERLLARIEALELPVHIQSDEQGDKTRYRVAAGPFESRDHAKRMARVIADTANLKTTVEAPRVGARSVKPVMRSGETVYVIGLGSFSNPENARRVLSRVQQMAVTAFTQEAEDSGRHFTRVLAGPFPDKPRAKAMAQSLFERLKLWRRIPGVRAVAAASLGDDLMAESAVSSVSEPIEHQSSAKLTTERSPSPTVQEVASSARKAVVHVAAFLHQQDADALEDKLVMQGLTAYQRTSRAPGGRRLYEIMVGPFDNLEQAQRAERRVRQISGVAATAQWERGGSARRVESRAQASRMTGNHMTQPVATQAVKVIETPSADQQDAQDSGLFSETGRQDYTVYVGFFSNYDNAVRLAGQIEKLGYRAMHSPVRVRGREMTSVCVGPFRALQDARSAAKEVVERTAVARTEIRDASFSGRKEGCGAGEPVER